MKRFYFLLIVTCHLTVSGIYAQQRQTSNKITSIERNEKDNTVKNIVFTQNANLPLENSMDVLKQYLQISDPDISLVESKTTKPYTGITVVRYQQLYRNIKVEHGTYSIIAKNGMITSINGSIYKPETRLPITTTLTEEQALQRAIKHINARTYMWEDTEAENSIRKITKNSSFTYKPVATKVWVEDFFATPNKVLHLAYRFNISAKEPFSNNDVYVDANSGKILMVNNKVHHASGTGKSLYNGVVPFETTLYNGSYILRDTTRGGGVYTCDMQRQGDLNKIVDYTNATTAWPVVKARTNAGVEAHWGAEMVYDYWKKVHNRNSFDDLGTQLTSLVDNGGDIHNAFWFGQYNIMVYCIDYGEAYEYGDSYVCLDVCGHEIAHGVCQYTAGLIYQAETGALNEALSDIWGANIVNYVAPNKPIWHHDADIFPYPGRFLNYPKRASNPPQPDTYNGINWYNTTGPCNNSNDNCGVHYNSGVVNKWYYLLAAGDSGTNDLSTVYKVAGIGMDKSAKIVYAAELMLSPSSNFSDFRSATISSATAIFGTCTPELEAVYRAWNAVGIGAAYVPCGPQIAFAKSDTTVEINPAATNCPTIYTFTIPVRISSTPTGGNAVIAVVDSGTAVKNIDYTISSGALTFAAGSDATQYVTVNILNHGAVDKDKELFLKLKLTANGSNAVRGNLYHEFRILIRNKNMKPQENPSVDFSVGKGNQIIMTASPFRSGFQSANVQFIIPAKDIKASGLKPNEPISHISFNVLEKYSTRPFIGFTISMGLTTISEYPPYTFITGLRELYKGDYSTVLGWNKFKLNAPFLNPFLWDGTSNIVCNICFTNGAPFTDATDKVEGTATDIKVSLISKSNSGANGCSLLPTNFTNMYPNVRLTQYMPATTVETAAVTNRSWDIHQKQNVYFYNSTNGKLIANINMPSQDLGCVTASLTKQGNGFTALGATTINRSVKEFNISPTINGTTTNYQATFYLDSTEIDGTNLNNVRILKTNTATDALINNKNSQIVTPVVSSYIGYKGFTADFTGFARYFLITDSFKLPPPTGVNSLNGEEAMRVDNNPFTDKIYVSYNFNNAVNADINLFDITGKLLYSRQQNLSGGNNRFVIDLGNLSLTPGNYVLQIITPNEILRKKMMRE